MWMEGRVAKKMFKALSLARLLPCLLRNSGRGMWMADGLNGYCSCKTEAVDGWPPGFGSEAQSNATASPRYSSLPITCPVPYVTPLRLPSDKKVP